MPSVSVVIPCYNSAHTIKRAVLSAHGQTLRPHEIIVVDDQSEDDSFAVLMSLQASLPELVVERQMVNGGPAAARNRGLELATGDLIAFLDADDEWAASKLQVQAEWMVSHPGCALSGHELGAVPGEIPIPSADVNIQWVGRARMLAGNPFVTSSVMVTSDVRVRFDPAQRFSEEFAVWLKLICVDGAPAAIIRWPLATRHSDDSGLSSHLVDMERAELGNYAATRRAGGITTAQWVLACTLSIAKFTRRVILRTLR